MTEAWQNESIEIDNGVVDVEMDIAPAFEDQVVRTQRLSDFGASVRSGLTAPRKKLSSMYLYDAIGSALFEAICHLREYKCTVGEKRNLRSIGGELNRAIPDVRRIVELGGGSGEKAALLLESISAQQGDLVFHNVDISAKALELSQSNIAALPGVRFMPHRDSFERGLAEALSMRNGEPILVLFLGSSIGNFDRPGATNLLKDIRRLLHRGDHLLLGTDLVKPERQLISAYDDPQGVTAAFNMNLLARMNFELGADFNLRRFRHEARWVTQGANRIEMHLVSTVAQTVNIPGAGLIVEFRKGESILTEKSHKYTPVEISRWANEVGFDLMQQWIDKPSLFADNLLQAR